MKRILNFFRRWIQQWKDYFQMRINDRLTKKLFKAELKRQDERIQLKKEIVDYIKTEWKVNPKSKHIPFNIRRQIVEAVYKTFRPRMEPLKVDVNYNLTFTT